MACASRCVRHAVALAWELEREERRERAARTVDVEERSVSVGEERVSVSGTCLVCGRGLVCVCVCAFALLCVGIDAVCDKDNNQPISTH